jgi:hypothetical protein
VGRRPTSRVPENYGQSILQNVNSRFYGSNDIMEILSLHWPLGALISTWECPRTRSLSLESEPTQSRRGSTFR